MHTTHELTSNDRTQAQERDEQALTRAYSSFSTLDTVSTLDSRLLYEQTPTADDATTLHHSIIITATIPPLPLLPSYQVGCDDRRTWYRS